MQMTMLKSQEEARQKAVDWQQWQAEQNLSSKELYDWEIYFSLYAIQYDLIEEFKENCII